MQRLAKKLVCSQLWAVGVRRGGVSHPARVLSSGRWFDRLIPEDDPETKLQKQKERELVLKKMTRSLFAELRAAPGEKTIATAELIHGAHSNGFPSCTAVPLAEDGVPSLVLPDALSRSHATLVTLCFQALGQAQLKKWTEPFAKAFSPLQINGEPAAAAAAWAAPPAMLNILYLEGFFFSALRRVFVSSSRNALSISERPYGAITFQTSDKETDVSELPQPSPPHERPLPPSPTVLLRGARPA